MLKNILATLALSLTLITGSQARSLPIDPGGDIFERLTMMAQLDKYGVEYHIDGVCISACTMFLGLDKVCMEPDSMLAFHSAGEYSPDGTIKISKFGNDVLKLLYPPKIRQWLDQNKALSSFDLTTMTSDVAYSLGVKKCEIK